VVNAFLDDGTDNIRAVFFRNQVESLLNKSEKEVLSFKDNPDQFQPVKEDLLGTIFKVGGRVTKNQMFERVEFIVNSICKADPKDAL